MLDLKNPALAGVTDTRSLCWLHTPACRHPQARNTLYGISIREANYWFIFFVPTCSKKERRELHQCKKRTSVGEDIILPPVKGLGIRLGVCKPTLTPAGG
jgi:hypothetical protein